MGQRHKVDEALVRRLRRRGLTHSAIRRAYRDKTGRSITWESIHNVLGGNTAPPNAASYRKVIRERLADLNDTVVQLRCLADRSPTLQQAIEDYLLPATALVSRQAQNMKDVSGVLRE